MNCRSCHREIPDFSIFCNWCGEKQLKQRKRKAVISVPAPVQLPSGAWRIQLRKEGKSFTNSDPDICKQEAMAYRLQWAKDEIAGLHAAKNPAVLLCDALDAYIASRAKTRSPSTIRGYLYIRNHRFQDAMCCDIHDPNVNWQYHIDKEIDEVEPKTVKNAWGLCASAIRFAKAQVPDVILPRVPKADRPWLSYSQIETFLSAVKGKDCELPALLALHSLRLSELLGLTPSRILLKEEKLLIRGSRVLNSHNELVFKPNNKTDASSRDIPFIIPRLKELLKNINPASQWVIDEREKHLYERINDICRQAGLPEVGVHGLRHSFASLAYHLGWKELSTMQVGGWTNSKVVHEIYTHNADLQTDIVTMQEFYSSMSNS